MSCGRRDQERRRFHHTIAQLALDRAPEPRPNLDDARLLGSTARRQHVRVPLETPQHRARLVTTIAA